MGSKEQKKSLATLLAESEREAARLQKLLDEDEIWHIPNPCDLYVWELTVYQTTVGTGYTNHNTHTRMCLTEDIAYEKAAYLLREAQVFGQSWQSGRRDEKLNAYFEEGKYRELVEAAQDTGVMSFKFQMIPIHSSGKPNAQKPQKPLEEPTSE